MYRHLFFTILILHLGCFSKGAVIDLVSSGDFSNPSIWQGSVVPGSGDDVTIPSAGGPKTLTISDVRTINSLTVEVNATLTITGTGSLTINGNLVANNNFTITVSNGVSLQVNGDFIAGNGLELSISGDVDVTGSFSAGNNTNVDIASGGTLSIDGDYTSGGGTSTINVDGTLSVDGTIDTTGKDVTGTGTIESVSCGDDMIGGGGIQCSTPLPITLGSFELVVVDDGVLVQWTTVSEENFDFFIIQRATAEFNFIDIGTVNGAGNSDVLRHYQYFDPGLIAGLAYYRLKAVDFDGSFEIFNADFVEKAFSNDFKVYPNPFVSELILETDGLSINSVGIFDERGRTMPFVESTANGKNIILLSDLKTGIYFLKVTTLSGYTYSHRIVRE